MPTDCLFRDDSYLKECQARVVAVTDQGGIVLDRTVFYASSGGQPGDTGTLVTDDGTQIPIATAIFTDAAKSEIAHVPASGSPALKPGDTVTAAIDWDKRHARMRMHTALHLLCSLVPFPVTGGQIGAEEGRLDFDIEDASAVDKDRLTDELNRLIGADHPVSERWISDAELEANPGLVRTMSVKPPMGTGRIRLVLIGEGGRIDMQPCGGTHVRSTGEIGAVAVSKIEKKGKINRRIRVALA